MNIVVTLSFVGSICAVWAFSSLMQKDSCLDVRLLFASATFLALGAVVFNVFWMFGLDRESIIMMLACTLLVCAVFLSRMRHNTQGFAPRTSTRELRELSKLSPFFVIIIASFLLYLYPSLPSFLPVGANVDGGNHLAITNVVIRTLENSTNPQSIVANNLGFHVNLAFIAVALGTHVELTIYPFACLIVALLVGCCYAFVVRIVPSCKLCVALACFIFATSAPLINLAAIDVSWATLLAVFMVSTAILILTENRSSLLSRTVAVTPIIVGTTFVYALFGGVIPVFIFLFTLWNRPRTKQIVMSLGVTLAATVLSYALFINSTVWGGAVAGMRYIVLPGVTRFYYLDWLGIIPLFLSIVALGKASLKEHPGPFVFVLSVCTQAVAFISLASILVPGTYFPYFMLKMSYLLPLPLSVLSGLGLHKLMSLHLTGTNWFPSFPTRRKVLRFIALLIVILVVLGSLGESYQHLTNTRPVLPGVGLLSNLPIPITPDQYQLAIWVRHHLHQQITLSGNGVSGLYFWGIMSSKWYKVENFLDNKYADRVWWGQPAISFDRWNNSAIDGDIIVSLQSKDFWNFYFSHRKPTTLILNYSSALVTTNATGTFMEWMVSPNMISYSAGSTTLTVPTFQANLEGLIPQWIELTDNTGVQATCVPLGFSDNALTFGRESNSMNHTTSNLINATALVRIRVMASSSAKVARAEPITTLRITAPRRLFGYTILFENDETIVVEKTSNESATSTYQYYSLFSSRAEIYSEELSTVSVFFQPNLRFELMVDGLQNERTRTKPETTYIMKPISFRSNPA